ncbi:MAG TPA: hypothetical protein VFU02_08275, partial [Polyangiaceae bacterium]|nr:hypothetical protein [Polyangiaceae bacterium]
TVLGALIALATGCSGSSDANAPAGETDGSGGDSSGTSDSASDGSQSTAGPTTSADCEGAFTAIAAPYAANTSIEDWGGFVADEQGLVFTALPDTAQDSYDVNLPSLLLTSDLSGNVKTIYTFPDGAMPGPIFTFGDDLYFVEGLLSRSIMKIPRAGGNATLVSDAGLRTGPVSDGETLYYAARPTLDSVIVALDVESGETQTLGERGNVEVVAIAVDGETLYFVETEDQLSEEEASLYSMPISGGDPELVMQLPYDTALGSFRVVDEVAFGSAITEDFSIAIDRIEFGEAPVRVEDEGGMPMVIVDDSIYYNAYDGLVRNSLAFDDPRVVSDGGGQGIYAIAVSDSAVWYAVRRCIYQAPR